MRRNVVVWLVTLLTTIGIPGIAQVPPARWERRSAGVTPPLALFHSTHVFHLPTAEVLRAREFEVVIAHRFGTPVSGGIANFFGLDGPANIRLSLAYAPSDHLLVTLGRSNWRDNVDLSLKWRALSIRSRTLPLAVAVAAGGAWNTEMPLRRAADKRNLQFFAQLIVNTMVGQHVALGVVPSYLRNPAPEANVAADALTLGAYTDIYLSPMWALVGEWNMSAPQPGFPDYDHDALAFGVQLETGGHFFKLLVTNNPAPNESQYLAGAPYSTAPREWRLGFNITRLLGGKRPAPQ